MGSFIDMTGWLMSEHGVPDSMLTVIKKAEGTTTRGKVKWICKCSCSRQNIVEVDGCQLRSGKTKSCGCLVVQSRKLGPKALKKYNLYSDKLTDEHGEYYIGWTTNTNREFYVDASDFDLIKSYCWAEHKDTTGYCALQSSNEKGTKTIRMHWLFGCKGWDHEDRNAFNNRRYNLRPASFSENDMNRSVQKNNTSGFIGVHWCSDRNLWQARININKKRVHLGYFTDLEAAVKTRLRAEKEYYGEFAPQRHLFEEYGIV